MEYRIKEEVCQGKVRFYPQHKITFLWGMFSCWSNFEEIAGLMCNWVVNFSSIEEAQEYINNQHPDKNYTKIHKLEKDS